MFFVSSVQKAFQWMVPWEQVLIGILRFLRSHSFYQNLSLSHKLPLYQTRFFFDLPFLSFYSNFWILKMCQKDFRQICPFLCPRKVCIQLSCLWFYATLDRTLHRLTIYRQILQSQNSGSRPWPGLWWWMLYQFDQIGKSIHKDSSFREISKGRQWKFSSAWIPERKLLLLFSRGTSCNQPDFKLLGARR